MEGQGPHCLKMFGAKAVPNWQGRTNQSVAAEGLFELAINWIAQIFLCFGIDVFFLLGGTIEPSTANLSIQLL